MVGKTTIGIGITSTKVVEVIGTATETTTGHRAETVRGPPKPTGAVDIGRMIGMREIGPGIVKESTGETAAEIEIEIETVSTVETETRIEGTTIEVRETTEEAIEISGVIETIGEIEETTGEVGEMSRTSEEVAGTRGVVKAETGREMPGVLTERVEAIERKTVEIREIVSIGGQEQGPTTEMNKIGKGKRALAKKF